ncbi:hypothetical protein E2562_009282 [Oryza meyeriana var. granulata]|uniref:Uncharacterized protein n=1 Tax=Oryza meyeriana var. granulata TaxID=110450 RepID=A0A6G1EA46_9ORYZ|nr:hypothetical protein E2562_009282 [Oryza meyeriana var. granulata]
MGRQDHEEAWHRSGSGGLAAASKMTARQHHEWRSLAAAALVVAGRDKGAYEKTKTICNLKKRIVSNEYSLGLMCGLH